MARYRIALAAGGTGGHVFPAQALYDVLTAQGHHCVLLTDARGQAYAQGIPESRRHVLPSGGVVSGSLITRLKGLMLLASGYLKARRMFSLMKLDGVVGFGGYPSAPPLLAAQHLGLPTILHEQNSVMGRANQLVGKKANVIALSMPETDRLPDKRRGECITTGNPVRDAIALVGEVPYAAPDQTETIRLLVLGGSLGAQIMSERVPEAVKALPETLRQRLHITQQARDENAKAVQATYQKIGVRAEIAPFFSDVPQRLRETHLVICRAGATSLAEMAAAGRPAIFIPIDWFQDGHQVKNAESLSTQGAAWSLPQRATTVQDLSDLLTKLFTDPSQLAVAANKAKALAKPDAANHLAEVVLHAFNTHHQTP